MKLLMYQKYRRNIKKTSRITKSLFMGGYKNAKYFINIRDALNNYITEIFKQKYNINVSFHNGIAYNSDYWDGK